MPDFIIRAVFKSKIKPINVDCDSMEFVSPMQCTIDKGFHIQIYKEKVS